MSEQPLDYLKKLYEYEAWRGRNTLEERLFIWQFYLSGREIPDWQARHVQALPAMKGFPPMIQSAWQPGSGKAETLLTVDVFECNSLAAAHEFLLKILGQFQGPALTRRTRGDTGDVAFSTPGDTLILFARANLVLQVSNAGRSMTPVTGIARTLDEEFVRKPEQASRTLDGLQEFPTLSDKRDVRVLLYLREYARPERLFWYKFFARNGEVFIEDGMLLYRQTSEGPQEVTLFEVRPSRDTDRPKLPFNFR